MRTSTAAWAAALAVMSITGPFTTAEAAPARPLDAEEPRPILHPLEKKSFLNETISTIRTRDPDPAIVPNILGGSSSTSSDTTAKGNAVKHNRLSVVPNLLSPGLLPSSSSFLPSSSSSIPPPRAKAKSKDDSRTDGSRTTSDNDPLLGSITGALPNILPTDTTTSSDNIIVGLTTVLHNSLPTLVPAVNSLTDAVNSELSKATGKHRLNHLTQNAGGLSALSGTGGVVGGLTSDLTGVVPTPITQPVGSALSQLTQPVGSALSQATGTGVIPPVASPLNSALSNAGITGVGTGIVPLPAITPDAGSILSSVQSEVTSAVSGLATPTSIVPALASSLQSKLSSIQATVTDPAIVSAVSSGFSSILSSVGSSVNGTIPVVGPILSNPTAPIGSIITNPVSGVEPIVSSLTGQVSLPTLPIPTGGITITGAGTTVVVPVPTTTGLPTGISVPLPGVGTTTGSSDGTTSTPRVGTGFGGGTTAATSTLSTTDGSPISPSSGASNTSALTQSTTGTSTSTSTDTAKNGPLVSIKPTATDSQTTMSLPTVWTFAPGSATKEAEAGIQTASSATASSSGLPTYLPKLVQPAGGSPEPGSNFTLVQVGFKFGLNYPFVVSRPESASQIFTWLPQGLAHGLGISEDSIMMNALVPYNTAAKLGFVTTLAQAWIPSDIVNQLQLDLHTAAAPLYDPPTTRIKQLMDMINPTIPLIPGTSLDGVPEDSTAFDIKAAAGAGENTGSGAPIGGDSGTSNKVRGTSVGIGAGAVAGAAVYAAAMMYVARRYRQKRKGHHRVSSVPAVPGEMTQRSSGGMGSLFMSGANGRPTTTRGSLTGSNGRNSRTSHTSSNGRSVREQGISAPLMSENSLGWN